MKHKCLQQKLEEDLETAQRILEYLFPNKHSQLKSDQAEIAKIINDSRSKYSSEKFKKWKRALNGKAYKDGMKILGENNC